MDNKEMLVGSADDVKQIAAAEFLFVNNSTESRTYKVGNRFDVRSHNRKQAARRFTQTHKAGRGGRPGLPSAQKHDHNTPKVLLHDHGCPFGTFTAPSLASSSTDRIAYSEHNSRKDFSAIPKDATELGTSLMRSASSAGTISLDDSVTAISNELQEGYSASTCKYCGGHRYNQLVQSNQALVTPTVQRRRIPGSQSPRELLGAGRVDPFSSYPVEQTDQAMHELVDHAVTYLIPGFFPKGSSAAFPPNTPASSWVSAALTAPYLFHALVFIGSCHLDFMHLSQIFADAPRALQHKLSAIQKLKEIISTVGPETPGDQLDRVILTALVLANHGNMKATVEKKKPFNSPLEKAQWLHMYGHIEQVPEHLKALIYLVTLRGGVTNIELQGLATVLVGGEVLRAAKSLSKPLLPALPMQVEYVNFIKAWATSRASICTPIQAPGSAFWRLTHFGITEAMLQALDSIAAYAMAVDHYIQGSPDSLTLGEITRAKNAIHGRLLLLPNAGELNIMPSSTPNLYESCRLTSIIFSTAVVLPIPNTHGILQTLVRQLKVAIEVSGLEEFVDSDDCENVFLWILMLGGIAALDKAERPWYSSQLGKLAEKLKIDWEEAENILETFLWLESACSSGGRQLWEEAKSSAE